MYVIYIYICYIYINVSSFISIWLFIYINVSSLISIWLIIYINVSSFISIWLISFLEKRLALHLNKLYSEIICTKFGLNCPSNSPDALKVLGKGHDPSFAKTESPLTKDAHGEDNC